MIETIFVYGVVLICCVYALAKLAPKSLKQPCARWLLTFNVPRTFRIALEKIVAAGVGCDGCSQDKPASNNAQAIVFFRKKNSATRLP